MKHYERPAIFISDQLAESVYMVSGQTYSMRETTHPDSSNSADDSTLADPNGSLETSFGSSTGDIASSVGDTPETEDGDLSESTVEGEVELGEAEPEADASPEDTDPEHDIDTEADNADGELTESGSMQGASLVSCNSKYMNGVWQGAKEGSWGGVHLGVKDLLGCTGCPADKGDGCGLQDSNADSRYLRSMGTLMPSWESEGKLPTDSPYGIGL
jgi:hypothetical protein